MKDIFPAKNTVDKLGDEIQYSQKLINVIEKNEQIASYPKVKEKLNLLHETLEDDIEQLQISSDADAKIGHKTADSSFFGYKTHIAMSQERIITAATITTGEKNDGKELREDLLKHKEWILDMMNRYEKITISNIDEMIEKEVGIKFLTVLEHAGVFKRDKAGQTAFDNFIISLGVRNMSM